MYPNNTDECTVVDISNATFKKRKKDVGNHFNEKYNYFDAFNEFKYGIKVATLIHYQGESKYPTYSWENTYDEKVSSTLECSHNAIMRHLALSATDTIFDKESYHLHISHAVCRSMMAVTQKYRLVHDLLTPKYMNLLPEKKYFKITYERCTPEVHVFLLKNNLILKDMTVRNIKYSLDDCQYKDNLEDYLVAISRQLLNGIVSIDNDQKVSNDIYNTVYYEDKVLFSIQYGFKLIVDKFEKKNNKLSEYLETLMK